MNKIFYYTLQTLAIVALFGAIILAYKTYQYVGSLTPPANEINLSAARDGLVHYKVKEGDKVHKNEVVAYLDYSDLAKLKKQQYYTYLQAERAAERAKFLVERKAMSKQDYEAAYFQAKQDYANMMSIKEQIDQSKLISPVNGTVSSLAGAEGQGIASGDPILTITTQS
ncbi:MAG TPA: hypothetical protein QF753_19325 [Victivallales bacterium]|nr:hypothetical protein [Victivallales bacterium]